MGELLEDGRGKQTPKSFQREQHLNLSPVKFLLAFWLPELWEHKFAFFQATMLVMATVEMCCFVTAAIENDPTWEKFTRV